MMRELQLEYERLKSDLSERNIDGSLRNSDSWENSVSPDLLRLEELHQDLNRLRQENKGISRNILCVNIKVN